MLPRLTSLRIFGALAVFLFHIGTTRTVVMPAPMYELGYVGVSFFFVLSGFVLAWGTRPGLPARTFYRRRFARIWPSHVTMLLVAAVVPVVSVARSWQAAVANVFLVQAWFVSRPDIVYGMNGPSWSLSCEAFFYACFPAAVVILRRVPRNAQWALCAASLGLAAVAAVTFPGAAFTLPPVRFSEFLLGLVAGLAVRDGWRPRIGAPTAGVAVVLGLVASSRAAPPLPDAIMALPFLLLILCLAARDLEARSGWLTGRIPVFAGEASFAFYLVHELVIVNLQGRLTGRGATDAVLLFLLAASAATALHLGVERPMNRLLRGRSPSLALRPPSEVPPPAPDPGAGDRAPRPVPVDPPSPPVDGTPDGPPR
jgi:peptidoglycan/LPS O-acetylase OafA/YrhL